MGAKSKSATLDGALVGGEAGYNMMMNSNIVLGVAGDLPAGLGREPDAGNIDALMRYGR